MRLLLISLLTFALSPAVRAQHSHGYLFAAPGGTTSFGSTRSTLHLGAGVEGVLGKGVGLGIELGAVGPTEDFSAVVGLLSPNGYYHFLHSADKVDPFVTAGYSLLFRSGTANLFNFGGGVNYWFIPRIGVKVEVRDHVWSPNGAVHYWGVRLGLIFR